MNWLKKYWVLILALAFIAMLVSISAGLYIKLAILTTPSLLYIIYFLCGAIVLFIFWISRKEDLAQEQLIKKYWILQNIRQLAILVLVLLGLGYWVFKVTEASKSELFNRLVEVMEENLKPSESGYYRDVTNIVCSLVTIEKLNKMMQDKYAQKRTRYFESSTNASKTIDDSEWWIQKKSGYRILQLQITINKIDESCEASLSREADFI